MALGKTVQERTEAQTALALMVEALELLDRTEYTLEVGPHLDLAICRLRESLDGHLQGTQPNPEMWAYAAPNAAGA